MAWSNSDQYDRENRLRQIISFLFAAFFISVVGWVLYQVYNTYLQIKDSAKERMSQKNVNISRKGASVGVRSMGNEKYVDRTQNWVVRAWNLRDSSKEDAAAAGGEKKQK